MPFENFRPKPKQETAPIISENTTENKESIENQIEQETVKLDANLESLKQQIDKEGGMERINKNINENKENIETGKLIGTVIPAAFAVLPLLISLSPGGIDSFAGAVSGDINDAVMTGTARMMAGLGVVGGALATYLVGSTVPSAMKSWWENRKLKSLKNKAEAAGVV